MWSLRRSPWRCSYTVTKEPLWIHGFYNPPWVQEELARRGLHPLVGLARIRDRDLNETITVEETKEEKMLSVTDENDQEGRAMVASLKACTKQKDLRKGIQIHATILDKGLLQTNIYVGNHLINMYAKCGALAKAQGVFENLPARNVVIWNALIAGYVQHGLSDEALRRFGQMRDEGLS
eukprot:c44226_g1_i1 orf=2-535(-)